MLGTYIVPVDSKCIWGLTVQITGATIGEKSTTPVLRDTFGPTCIQSA